MSFGERHAIEDRYGQTVGVEVDMGDADVEIHWRSFDEGRYCNSVLTADQAENVAEQLRAAAAYARTLTPHE